MNTGWCETPREMRQLNDTFQKKSILHDKGEYNACVSGDRMIGGMKRVMNKNMKVQRKEMTKRLQGRKRAKEKEKENKL